MAEIPIIKKRRWWSRKWIPTLFVGLTTAVAMGIVAYSAFSDPNTPNFIGRISGTCSFVIAVSSLWISWISHVEEAKADRNVSLDGLRACVIMLHRFMIKRAGKKDPAKKLLRITVHRVEAAINGGEDTKEFEQVINYVGRPGGGVWRRTNISKGIVGRAYRVTEDDPRTVAFAAKCAEATNEKFIEDMVADFGFTNIEAQALKPGRYSWLAMPITDSSHKPVGIVYFDSSDPDFFDFEGILGIALEGVLGIAESINMMYN